MGADKGRICMPLSTLQCVVLSPFMAQILVKLLHYDEKMLSIISGLICIA